MRRFIFLAVAILATVGFGAVAARGDQSPGGHLGNPDSITKGTGLWDIPIVVPTDMCAGFTSGNSLVFTNVDVSWMRKFWAVSPTYGDGWYEMSQKLSGSAVVGGQTYTLRADLFLSHAYIETTAHGSGSLVVTRSDGSRMRGRADLSDWDFASPYYDPPPGVMTWHDEFGWFPDDPTCK